jgi:large subunit ribosomal protein L18
MLTRDKEVSLKIRHMRIRKKVSGTAHRPRVSVHRSHLNMTAQAIDDVAERTVLGVSTLAPSLRKNSKRTQWGNLDAAKEFGAFFAHQLKAKKIEKVIFDRGGWQYHGRVRAFADALRENGIQF